MSKKVVQKLENRQKDDKKTPKLSKKVVQKRGVEAEEKHRKNQKGREQGWSWWKMGMRERKQRWSREKTGTQERGRKGGKTWLVKVGEWNRRWPWLKAVVGLAVVLIIGGGVAVAQGIAEVELAGRQAEAGGVTGESTDVAPGSAEGGENDGTDGGETGVESDEDVTGVNEEVTEAEMPAENSERDLTGKKLVALTFDDGPSAETTGRLLDILQEKGVKATFFVLGTRARAYPDLVQREVAEGHEVGTHSLQHANLSKMEWEAVAADLNEAKGITSSITGVEPRLLRPPYGAINDAVRGMGMPIILWTVDPDDWKDKDVDTVRWRVVNYAFDGAIILMHDIYSTTVEAVAGVIDDLRGWGYEFLTVGELAGARGVGLEGGVSYGSFRP